MGLLIDHANLVMQEHQEADDEDNDELVDTSHNTSIRIEEASNKQTSWQVMTYHTSCGISGAKNIFLSVTSKNWKSKSTVLIDI